MSSSCVNVSQYKSSHNIDRKVELFAGHRLLFGSFELLLGLRTPQLPCITTLQVQASPALLSSLLDAGTHRLYFASGKDQYADGNNL